MSTPFLRDTLLPFGGTKDAGWEMSLPRGSPSETPDNRSGTGRVRNWGWGHRRNCYCGFSSLGLVPDAENGPDREDDSQATEAPAPPAETPTRLQQAATGITEAQAWKGQQMAKGWRKLVNALRRPKRG